MTPLRERCRGRWRSILPALGINPSYLTGKNGPCPLCRAGRDRWRFDNKRGDGTWICTHCGAGQGIKLAMMFTGISEYKAAAQQIERVLGEAPIERLRSESSEEAKRAVLNELWRSGNRIRPGDPADLWLRARGIGMSVYPDCLRSCMRVRYSGPPLSFHPAMLAKVTDSTGRPVTIHKTYLTAAGTKAAVDRVRMFCPGRVPPGGAVRLAEPGPVMGAAEGVESALAAAKLFRVPVWAALSDVGLEKFVPPQGTERLIAFGDNDKNGAGQGAAFALASRLAASMHVEVRIPDAPGTDWNDVLQAAGGG
jgi:putative DNA primase/helicase